MANTVWHPVGFLRKIGLAGLVLALGLRLAGCGNLLQQAADYTVNFDKGEGEGTGEGTKPSSDFATTPSSGGGGGGTTSIIQPSSFQSAQSTEFGVRAVLMYSTAQKSTVDTYTYTL